MFPRVFHGSRKPRKSASERPQHSLPTHARLPRCHRCPPLCADGARRNERSPWCRPFPPDSPPTISRPCSNPSRVLVARSDSSAPYTWAVRHVALTHRPANSRAGQRSPGPRAESFLTCTGSTDRAGRSCRSRCRDNRCGLPLLSTGSAPGSEYFAAQWPARQCLKSTLHPRCRHRRRITRGQRGSLFLRCGAPSSPTLRRFYPGAFGGPLSSQD